MNIQEGLRRLIDEKKCFKLVCGAGNEDIDEVEKLVAIYSKAGARYFDLSANLEVVRAAYRGLARVIPETERRGYFFNVSVGIKGDPHVSKAHIEDSKCLKCGACKQICPQDAISFSNDLKLNKLRCIGCGRCIKVCPSRAMEIKSEQRDLKEVLTPLLKEGIDSIELHAVSDDSDKIIKQWQDVCEVSQERILSICMDRSKASDTVLKERIGKMIENRKPNTVIIQADGAPMSGGKDDYSTTLQAIATAQIVQRMNYPVYLLLSGGTNSKSVEMANMCGVKVHGVSIGLYGRNLVKEYTQNPDFWNEPRIYEQAYLKARKLVEKCLNDLSNN